MRHHQDLGLVITKRAMATEATMAQITLMNVLAYAE